MDDFLNEIHEQENLLKKNKRLLEIANLYSEKELEAIAKGGRIVPGLGKVPIVDFDGTRIRFGLLGDTHFGSIYTDPDMWEKAINEFKKEGCDFVAHTGDLVEGMSNRPDHVYQCSHIGYTAQKNHAIEMLQMWDKKMYIISGNHDRWYIKNAGADIIEDVVSTLDNIEYIGHDQGRISLKGQAIFDLWHGEDGSSYAISYRLQKIVESIPGGDKPHILGTGHVHKTGYFFIRNIHCITAGSIQKQSAWMRSTRKEAHVGFWIVDAWIADHGISKLTTTWYPFYQ